MLDYLKVFPEFETMLRRYTDEERGRLFMAMMAYAYRGEEPDFAEDAHEWYIWDTIKLKIDQCAETLESKRASGKKGGSAKQTEADTSKANQSEAEESNVKHIEADASTPKQTQAEASKAKQTEADTSKTDIYKNKNKNKSSSSYVPPTPYDDLDDDELLRLRQEQQDVETAARRVGLPVSAAGDYDTMDALRAYALQVIPVHLERFGDDTVGHVLLHASGKISAGDIVLHSAQSAVNGRLDRHRQKRLVVLYLQMVHIEVHGFLDELIFAPAVVGGVPLLDPSSGFRLHSQSQPFSGFVAHKFLLFAVRHP